MTVQHLVSTIATLAGLTFVVGSMFATGLSLTVAQIVQPLKNARLVILALVANFVLVPLLGYVITLVIPLDEPLKIGLIVLSTAAGAPFLVKEVQASKGEALPGRRADVPADDRDHLLRAARPAAAAPRRRRGRRRHRQVADRDDAHPHRDRPPVQVALGGGRQALGAGDEQASPASPCCSCWWRARPEHLQHHRPDRLVRLPGARRSSSSHRWRSASSAAAGMPTSAAYSGSAQLSATWRPRSSSRA